ncbi:MAG TPA: PleD family two-component system response regulator [Rhodospirillaceae bacterium]|nr:PleD family two-component system response regulator [Rhodospirillaceae bacterium]
MSARILIVDDTPLNLKLLTAKLAKDYYLVSTAASGPEALEAVRRDMPDLILLDIMMPEMDGFEVCTLLKKDPATQHIPVVMVTALNDVKDRVRGLECGADDFLSKPINDIALMSRVRSLLRLKMIMDEWRLREATASQFALYAPQSEPITDQGGDILLLEDSDYDASTLEKQMIADGRKVTRAKDIEDALEKASHGTFDMVMVSLELNNGDGLYLCAQLRAQETTRALPVLLMANEGAIEKIGRGLDLGANDYLLRPIEKEELFARLRTQLRQKRHHDRLHKNYEQNLTLALVDPLTGAYNRRYLDMHLPMLFSRSQTTKRPLSVLSFDLDHFKNVNDTKGHKAGDTVLKEVINRVIVSLRPSDLVVRMGGEEFAVIMPETELKTAMNVAERLREDIADTPVALDENGDNLPVSASFGVATLNHTEDKTPTSILDRADAALYRAKETGRNKVVSEDQG